LLDKKITFAEPIVATKFIARQHTQSFYHLLKTKSNLSILNNLAALTLTSAALAIKSTNHVIDGLDKGSLKGGIKHQRRLYAIWQACDEHYYKL